MPKRKTLEGLSLHCVTHAVIDACEKLAGKNDEGVRWYVRRVPPHLANAYVYTLLDLASRKRWSRDAEVSLRDAFHPRCDDVDLSYMCADIRTVISTVVCRQLFDNLDAMPDLTTLRAGIYFPSDFDDRIAIENVHRMKSVRDLQLPVPVEPQLMNGLIRHCHQLERIQLLYPMSTNQFLLLTSFGHLQKALVDCPEATAEDIIYILDALPLLEVLSVPNMSGVLSEFQDQRYNLKDFQTPIDNDPGVLDRLVRHFPLLDVLIVRLTNVSTPLAPLNQLVGLVDLTIESSTYPLPFLTIELRPCLRRLTTFTLIDTSQVDITIKRYDQSVFPNVQNLSLYMCEDVDVSGISEVFPNLQHLCIEECEVTEVASPYTDTPFHTLQSLSIVFTDNVQEDHLQFLLCSCQGLESLELLGCNAVTVQVLVQINKRNPAINLRSLNLDSDHLREDILEVVLEAFKNSSCLEKVQLSGAHLSPMFLSDMYHLQKQLRMYDLTLCLSGQVVYAGYEVDYGDSRSREMVNFMGFWHFVQRYL